MEPLVEAARGDGSFPSYAQVSRPYRKSPQLGEVATLGICNNLHSAVVNGCRSGRQGWSAHEMDIAFMVIHVGRDETFRNFNIVIEKQDKIGLCFTKRAVHGHGHGGMPLFYPAKQTRPGAVLQISQSVRIVNWGLVDDHYLVWVGLLREHLSKGVDKHPVT